jgi:protocatechuate 3,4-dioxygenase beta subunit
MDLEFGRRQLLVLFGGAGVAALVGCGSGDDSASTATTTSSSGADTTTAGVVAADASCATIPEETAGPFPGDGSNGPNVLADSGVVRTDIRASFGSASGVAEGVPLTIRLTVLDGVNGCAPLPGASVYLWHCDREGRYSMYSDGVTGENYLRGVQEADADGIVSFTSVFPGAYPGRWPHAHFEVYPTLDDATSGGSVAATSQLALPQEACDAAYAADGYGDSVTNLAQLSLESDMVFADGAAQQLATMSGDAGSGFTAELTVVV